MIVTVRTVTKNDTFTQVTCILTISKHTFDQMVVEKMYKARRVKKLLERLWNNTKLKCGFNFKSHYLNSDATSGSMEGL